MLGFGGFGGLINMGYGMNAMVHNTSWVTAHFHLIFGGSVVIMYFAIAYEIWPRLTGREHPSLAPAAMATVAVVHRHDGHDGALALAWVAGSMAARRQLQLCRSHHRRLGTVGACLALRRFCAARSALLFVRNLAVLHSSALPAAVQRPLYALAVHPPHRVPAALNGFGLWNVLVLVLMLLAYGYPIAQFVIEPSPGAIVHRVH